MLEEYLQTVGPNADLIIALVLALGTLYGKVGLSGNRQLLAVVGTGFLLGGGYHLAVMPAPVGFAGWFYVLITALAVALIPVGVYETAKGAAQKALALFKK